MSRTISFSAAIVWLLIRHVHAGAQQNSNAGSISREPCFSKISSSCSEPISTRTLATASLGLDLVGGGSGSISLKSEDDGQSDDDQPDDEQSDDEVNSTAMRDHTKLNGGATTKAAVSPNHSSAPLRISSFKGKQIVREKKIDMRLQKKLERRRRKEEDKSHRVFAKKLKNRNHLNLSRKIVHAGFGLMFASLNHFLPREKFLPGMIIVSTGTLIMELLRYREGFGWMNDVLIYILGGSLRKHEMEGKFTGSFYYFLGVTITAASFPTTCATLGICQLALADPSASFFGRQTKDVYWSRIENGFFGIGRNKGFLGFLGGALFCLPFNYRVLSVAKFGGTKIIPGGQLNVAIASLALGVAGAFADLCVPTPALTMPKKILNVPMPPFHVDDNVVVPIFSGYACTKIFQYMGWTEGVDLARFFLL
eukprot:CAMPEP_0198264848 /NCGR_PEP_ID=MMETSP1447-20131203/18074_1 /TAXON_ID=420782 /ORGANISM="Chaetoceros dichaeta, Strain CCMP1751" /LENGTH=422 /DNA_ID=CAMNT_0043953977 /DNA_START=148 /DNA_END=1416 /DNA_ORIENTATION=+